MVNGYFWFGELFMGHSIVAVLFNWWYFICL